MPKPVDILKEEFLVTSADTDFSKNLRPGALINMIIQAAWHHAEILDFGMDLLHREGLLWILSKLHTQVHYYPLWNQQLTIQTWPKGINRLFYLRDFEIFDSKNQLTARATSEWLLIDMNTKRPKLIHPEDNIFEKNKDKHAIEPHVPVLHEIDSGYESFTNHVNYSDVDLNQHLTTTRYIDWMFDTFSLEFLKKKNCRAITVNFLREIPYNTKVDILRSADENSDCYQYVFRDSVDNKDLFRGKLSF